jgi:hypothetical protein
MEGPEVIVEMVEALVWPAQVVVVQEEFMDLWEAELWGPVVVLDSMGKGLAEQFKRSLVMEVSEEVAERMEVRGRPVEVEETAVITEEEQAAAVDLVGQEQKAPVELFGLVILANSQAH